MKLAMMSDIHGKWNELNYPEADVLIVAGDILPNYAWAGASQLDALRQVEKALPDFNAKLAELKQAGTYKEIVVVAGNHDWCFQHLPAECAKILTAAHYLENSGVEISGKKFWGSPWTRHFCNWAFNFPDHESNFYRAREHARRCWEQIPLDTSVLVTHGPPLHILDEIPDGLRVGDQYLLERIEKLQNLELHVFGHIHWSQGSLIKNKTVFVNAAICTEAYRAENPITIVTL